MQSDEYLRLSSTCLTMAAQSNLPDVQGRWRTLAQSCFSLAIAQSRAKECFEDKSNKKPIYARIASRLTIAWCTAHTGAELLVEPLSVLL